MKCILGSTWSQNLTDAGSQNLMEFTDWLHGVLELRLGAKLAVLTWAVTGLLLAGAMLTWLVGSIFHGAPKDFPMRDRVEETRKKGSSKGATITLRGEQVPVDTDIKNAVENDKRSIIRKRMKEIDPTVFESSMFWSVCYYLMDMTIILGLYKLRSDYESLLDGQPGCLWFGAYFLWINMVGFEMWALFVVGHDCGHRTFCKSLVVNNLFGHLAHTVLMVPFHGWRISHRTHHKFHSNLEKDESHLPIQNEHYAEMPISTKLLRFTPFMFFGYFFYLTGGPGWDDSDKTMVSNHFNPKSRLIEDETDKTSVIISDVWYFAWCGFIWRMSGGDWRVLTQWYFAPILVCWIWLTIVTYLHHTGPESVYYPDDTWNFTRGSLTTYDRDFGCCGIIDFFMHHINLHAAHHMFFLELPHYNLRRATRAYRLAIGEQLYAQQDMSHEWVFKTIMDSLAGCNVLQAPSVFQDKAGGLMYAPTTNRGVWGISGEDSKVRQQPQGKKEP